MDELLVPLRKLADQELRRANSIHPPFHSLHEAWGVIWEEYREMNEARKHLKQMRKRFADNVRHDNLTLAAQFLGRMQEAAVETAAEAIQIAAMCQKAKDYVNKHAEKD